MNFYIGQAILGRIPYPDGEMPEYIRPYLIVGVQADCIFTLNVSSTRGKERKLAFPVNEALIKYNPPFNRSSFVKLDTLTRIDVADFYRFRLAHNGARLDSGELERIIRLLNERRWER